MPTMPLLGSGSSNASSNPESHRFMANEAKADQRNLDHAIKDLNTAEKLHSKSVKATEKANSAIDKAVKKEHSAAQALNKAEHKLDAAVADQKNARKTLETDRQHETQLGADVQQRRSTMEEMQQRKDTNDQTRESTLAQLHQQAADRLASPDRETLSPTTTQPDTDAVGTT
ncbi:hypothetical protein B0H21DRAFT_751429 [Amylocystis lapponica]|nr:hypothetical protein B0H21DRAFT_751429 [Amylocystis lapponica]